VTPKNFIELIGEFKFEVQQLVKCSFLKNSSYRVLKPRVFLGDVTQGL
jgi:hypothetical protein